jgi:hypothetical protein
MGVRFHIVKNGGRKYKPGAGIARRLYVNNGKLYVKTTALNLGRL